ncbi:hypothetical protein J31TS4_40640 [Paenibacillus sp. J31TS4]|nr:hypothetical protein J31TS4_40640 [Paenibacillus sp. J31TS4]
MITTTKATHGMLINISNYGVYQSLDEYESNDESNEEIHANQLRKQREPNNINKNVENYKNDRDKTYIILPNDGHRFLNIYGFHFKKKFNKEHMKITEEQLSTILQQLEGLEDNGVSDYEFEDAVIEHFDELPESNNGSIIAFMHTTKRRLGF